MTVTVTTTATGAAIEQRPGEVRMFLACRCAEPQPQLRPSGVTVCLNDGCGGRVVDVPVKKARP